MFNRIVKELLEGAFICGVKSPDGYTYLQDDDNFRKVDDYLRLIDLRLSKTGSGMAFFLTHADLDDQGKKSAKALFTDIKNNIRPLVSFLDLIMRTVRDDNAISPGEKLEKNKLMSLIAQNPSLTEALRNVANQTKTVSSDGSDSDRFLKILRKFCKDGYLEEVNREEEIFKFTGKVEFVQEVIIFLMQNDQISHEDEAYDARKVVA